MTDMSDAMAWLRKQIAEDRRLAEAVGDPETDGAWYYSEPLGETVRSEAQQYIACGPYDGPVDEDAARHIVRHDPRTVLAQCDAHTAILDRYERAREAGHQGRYTEWELAQLEAFEAAVEIVALAYRHHPGYREEWRSA